MRQVCSFSSLLSHKLLTVNINRPIKPYIFLGFGELVPNVKRENADSFFGWPVHVVVYTKYAVKLPSRNLVEIE